MARHPHISSNLLSNFARLSTFQTCQGMLRAATSARASGPRLHQEREAKLFVSFPFLLIERSFMDDFGKRGKSRGCQAVAQRCLTIVGKYGMSGWFGTASRDPR